MLLFATGLAPLTAGVISQSPVVETSPTTVSLAGL